MLLMGREEVGASLRARRIAKNTESRKRQERMKFITAATVRLKFTSWDFSRLQLELAVDASPES